MHETDSDGSKASKSKKKKKDGHEEHHEHEGKLLREKQNDQEDQEPDKNEKSHSDDDQKSKLIALHEETKEEDNKAKPAELLDEGEVLIEEVATKK